MGEKNCIYSSERAVVTWTGISFFSLNSSNVIRSNMLETDTSELKKEEKEVKKVDMQ